MVNYGPPAQAISALPGLMADGQLHKYQSVMGYAPLLDAIRHKLAEENGLPLGSQSLLMVTAGSNMACLLYPPDAADEKRGVDIVGSRLS